MTQFLKKLAATSLLTCLLLSASSVQAQLHKPKPFVTPWEYYSQSRPAVLRADEEPVIQKAEYQAMESDTRSEKTNMVLIGTLVGVLAVGGAVAGILLATK